MKSSLAPVVPASASALVDGLKRRSWLKVTGGALAALAMAGKMGAPAAHAQHEMDRSVRSTEPIRLSSNESNYGVSQMVTMGIMQSAEAIMRYPHQVVTDLTAAIAAHEKVEPAQVALGFGSADVLEVLANHLGPKKGEIIAPNPTFYFFSEAMRRQGATVVNVPLTAKLGVDLEAMASKVTADTRCLYLVNPNNPTGTLLPGAQLRPFVIEMAKKCLVVVDEAYLDYSDDYESNTLIDLVRARHNVVITRTFSKIHGMAGQRIGYGIMPATLVKEAFGRSMLSGGFRINLLGAVAAKASLEDAAFRTEVQAKNKAEREKFCALLKSLKREYAEPQGSFVFFNTGMATEEFRTKMRAENILTGNGHPLYPNWCRITLGVPDEMVRVEAALKKILV